MTNEQFEKAKKISEEMSLVESRIAMLGDVVDENTTIKLASFCRCLDTYTENDRGRVMAFMASKMLPLLKKQLIHLKQQMSSL